MFLRDHFLRSTSHDFVVHIIAIIEVSFWWGEKDSTGEFERMKLVILFFENEVYGKCTVKNTCCFLRDILLYFKRISPFPVKYGFYSLYRIDIVFVLEREKKISGKIFHYWLTKIFTNIRNTVIIIYSSIVDRTLF